MVSSLTVLAVSSRKQVRNQDMAGATWCVVFGRLVVWFHHKLGADAACWLEIVRGHTDLHKVCFWPKTLVEEVATMHHPALSTELTVPSSTRIGVRFFKKPFEVRAHVTELYVSVSVVFTEGVWLSRVSNCKTL